MRMKRKTALLLAVILALCALCAAALARGEYLGTMFVVNCDDWVSLRSAPDSGSARLAKVPLGAAVEAYYYNGLYNECRYNGTWGYILSQYLSSDYGHVSYMGTMYVANCQNWVTLRRYPSTDAPEVTRVPLGASVEAYYYNGEFAYCLYDNLEGYILRQYLSDEPVRVSYMGTRIIANCDSWVTLRSGPSTGAGTVTRIPRGASVEAYYYNGEFAYCEYNGLNGFILLKYLR